MFCHKSGEKLLVYRGHTDWVSCVRASGAVVYTASKDHTLRAFEIAVLSIGETYLTFLNSGLIFFVLFDLICLIKTGRTLQVYQGHTDWVRCLVVDGEKELLYSGSSDQTIRCWEVRVNCTNDMFKKKPNS